MMGAFGYWGWFGLGLLLIAGEILAPGVFLIWFGFAALGVGVMELVFAPGWIAEVLIFAGLSVVAVLIGLRVYRGGSKTEGASNLNERVAGFRGQVFSLDEAIVNGFGRIRVGDSVWRVKGPDMAAGQPVKVCGVDGATLIVEAVRGDHPSP